MTTEKILSTIDWQAEGQHITKKGKIKKVRKGIPTNGFWYAWKRNKEEVKALGITVFRIGREKTGEHRTRKGKSREVTRSQWEVTQWLGTIGRVEQPF